MFSNSEVANAYKGVKVLPVGIKTQIGGFKVQPLPLKHNVENYGFIITTADNNKIVFATDCAEFSYKIRGVHHWIIESNYSDDIIIDNMCNNEYSRSASKNHLEILQTIDALKNNFCVDTQTIVLCHLSQVNADAKEFIQRVKNELCFENVFVADKGLEIELNKSEF